MAHHKSAIKRIRRNDRANVRNSQYLSAVRTAVKRFRLAVLGAGQGTFDKEAVRPLFVNAQSALGKAATKGILHRNNVSRKIGRLSAMLRSAEAGQVAQANVKATKKSASARRAEAAAEAPAPATATVATKAKVTKTAAKKAPAKTKK
ncbi:MAG: 30S ribosomal protein S20 [Proteobacteria bacterium]|nr:30S ribosomal protein S20 [Pseudomonadota bacterium]